MLIKQFFRLVAFHPAFKLLEVIRMLVIHQERHLVGPEGALDCRPSTTFGPVQPLGDLKTIMGHRGRMASFLFRAFFWICRMPWMALSKVAAMSWCIAIWIVPFDEVGRPSTTPKKLLEFLLLDTCQVR